jgi:Ca2+-binding RTX toxin-like protein
MALITLTSSADTYPGGTLPAAVAGDELRGLDGNDTIRGTTGGIIIAGNQGDDQLFAAGPNTTIFGGKNNDTLVSVSQSKLYGDLNDDSLVAVFSDSLYGGDGNDTLIGAPQAVLFGNAGNDSLVGSTQASLYGGKENDTLLGTGGGLLYGDVGNDFLVGTALDTLYGASNTGEDSTGADTLAARGAALMFGGKGADTLYSATGATVHGGQDGDLLTPNTIPGGSLGGLASGSVTVGGAVLYGDKGNDTLYGTVANSKADTLYGGDDNDLLSPVKTDATNYQSFGSVTLFAYGGGGADSVYGSDAGDSLFGGAPGETLDGNDTVMGRDGNDTMFGNGGADSLNGANGTDSIIGGDGNDSITGGSGSDTLTGGAGADYFFFVGSANVTSSPQFLSDINNMGDLGIDSITDFVSGEDKIVLDGNGTSTGFTGSFTGFNNLLVTNAVSLSVVTSDGAAQSAQGLIVYNKDNGKLFYNANGTDTAEGGFGTNAGQFATINTGLNLSSSDFIIV